MLDTPEYETSAERCERLGQYVLDNGVPRIAKSSEEWCEFMNGKERIIKQTEKVIGEDSYLVSSVFLGLDHNMMFDQPSKPILYECMVFKNGACLNGEEERAETKEQILEIHENFVKKYLL